MVHFSLLLIFLTPILSAPLYKTGHYCNLDTECETACCQSKKCAPIMNDCLALSEMKDYLDTHYCSLNVQCPSSRCCLHGECQPEYTPCFERYDQPLLYGGAGGLALGLFMLSLAWLLTPRVKAKIPIPPPVEVFVDDGGPLYYEAEEKLPEPEEPFVDDMAGPIYYEQEVKEEEAPIPEPTPYIPQV